MGPLLAPRNAGKEASRFGSRRHQRVETSERLDIVIERLDNRLSTIDRLASHVAILPAPSDGLH